MSAALALVLALPKRSDEDEAVRVATAFLVESEGVVLRVYTDTAGNPTAGIGRKLKPGQKPPKNLAEAMQWLREDVAEHEKCIRKYRDELEPWEYAAILSFVFNHGCSVWNSPRCSVRKHIEAGRLDLVPDAMMQYVNRRDPVTKKLVFDQGLYNRRAKEVRLWKGLSWERFSK